MANAIYGTAFIQIQPDFSGFQASVLKNGNFVDSGKKAGLAFAQGLGLAVTGAAIGVAIGRTIANQISSSIDESIKFESAFAGVLKTVDATVGQLDQLRSGIIEMSKVLPASREEIAGVAEAAGQLGIQTENILEFTKVMIDLGETTDLTADQAATAFAQIANVMKTPQTAFENMASTLVDLGNKGASTESQIIDFAQRIAGAGEIAGLAESDVLAIGSAMASVGVEAEAGGTAVQKVLLSITEAVATTNDDLEVFAQTAGLSAQEFARVWGEDAAGAFTRFVEGIGRAGDGAFQILEDLELTDQRLIRAFLSLAGAGELLSDQIEIGTVAWDENTAAADEANKRYETSAARLEVVKNRATELQREFGDQLVPIIVDLAEQHIPALENAFADLTTAIPGEADFLDFVNAVSTIPRALGQVVDLSKANFDTFTGLVEGFGAVLSVGLVGDTESAMERITSAWEDFGQSSVFRTAAESLAQSLREGEDSALAFANALAFVGRRGKIDPKVIRTLREMADVDPSQLVLELERLVELGPEIGLSAEDIDAVRVALLDLGPPSIEAVRQANMLARAADNVGEAFKATPRSAFGVVQAWGAIAAAAEEAGEDISLHEFILEGSDTVQEILKMLDPMDQIIIKIGAISRESELAAEIFTRSFTPSLVAAGDALTDLNDDGKVTVDEFIKNARELGLATLNFVENLNKIEDVSPELAAKFAALPLDQGALLAQQVADDLARVPEILDALNVPEELGQTLDDIVREALRIARKEGPDEALDFINFVNLLPLPAEIKADLIERIGQGLEAAKTDVGNLIEDAFAQEDAFNRAAGIGADAYDREIIRRVGSSAFVNGPDIGDLIEEAFTQTDAVKVAANVDAEAWSRALLNAVAADRLGIKGDLADTIADYFASDSLHGDLVIAGDAARRAFFEGLTAANSGEQAKLRDSISSTVRGAIYMDSPPKLFVDFGVASGEAFWSGFEDESVPQLEIDLPSQPFADSGTEAVRSFVSSVTDGLNSSQSEIDRSVSDVLSGLSEATEQTIPTDLSDIGARTRESFMTGLASSEAGDSARVRNSLISTLNDAIERQSPPQLFYDAGVESGEAFWSGVGSVDQVEGFGVDGQRLLGNIRAAAGSVSFATGGSTPGGVSIGQFTVQNPIGEPTEESVQAALLEISISPIVNRLVSAGSSL